MALRGLTLDAFGTLVGFGPPAPLLAASLGVPLPDAQRAARAEMAYYMAEHHRACDAAALAVLRRECAEVVEAELGTGRPLAEVEAALLDAIRFAPFPEVPATLRALRERGLRLVVCSNWDVSLREVLVRTGLAALVDGAVISAEEGVAKPGPELVLRALATIGVAPQDAWHVGDSLTEDVPAARAAGVRPILVARAGEVAPVGVTRVADLHEILGLLD